MQGEAAGSISNVPREYTRADALGHFCQQVAESLQNNRTDETMERRMLEVDILRREVVARIMMGGAFPDRSAPTLCARNAALTE